MVLPLKEEPCVGQAAVREVVLHVYIATIRLARPSHLAWGRLAVTERTVLFGACPSASAL